MSDNIIAKLYENGYEETDINDLATMLYDQIKLTKEQMYDSSHRQILDEIHKIKGGLRILYCDDLATELGGLENSIKSTINSKLKKELDDLLSDALKILVDILTEVG